ncbi:MAG: hydrogenase maturation protease [Peptococcaceae bacterium]|nr:hydrogenase maturation protease [Peptococcaceae bacterium]
MFKLQEIKILGIGNLVRQDEGVGIHLLQSLEGILPDGIELLDGGTGGLALLDFVESAGKLIILDAVDAAKEPGEVIVWRQEQVPYFLAAKMSVHQVSFAEVLNLAKFRGNYPEEIAVVGIQPETLDWGTELSEPVKNSLQAAVKAVLGLLEEWGISVPFQE